MSNLISKFSHILYMYTLCLQIDYASRDCQESFFKKMELSGQLQPGERPDPRWMQNQIAKEPPWEEGYALQLMA